MIHAARSIEQSSTTFLNTGESNAYDTYIGNACFSIGKLLLGAAGYQSAVVGQLESRRKYFLLGLQHRCNNMLFRGISKSAGRSLTRAECGSCLTAS
jgi:hypothetical protein